MAAAPISAEAASDPRPMGKMRVRREEERGFESKRRPADYGRTDGRVDGRAGGRTEERNGCDSGE